MVHTLLIVLFPSQKNLRFLYGDISSVIGTTGGFALLMVGYLLWLSDRDNMNL